MNQEIFDKAKAKFTNALCHSGIDEYSFKIVFTDELVDDGDYYSLLLSVTVNPFPTDEGECTPEPVTFQVDYDKDHGELFFIIGEDTQQEITYGNVFAYMYFSTIEPKTD